MDFKEIDTRLTYQEIGSEHSILSCINLPDLQLYFCLPRSLLDIIDSDRKLA